MTLKTPKTPKTFSAKPFTAKQISRQMPSRVAPASRRSWLYATAMMLTLTAAGALLAMRAQAQTPEPDAAAPVQAAPAQVAPSPAAAPKYAAKDMALAFSYMDANKDGKVSREEAAGFRGVARHFDEADTNRDGFLSSQEFESALNGRKPQ